MSLLDITNNEDIRILGDTPKCPECRSRVIVLRRALNKLKECGQNRNYLLICAVCGTKTKAKRRKVDAIHCWEA